MEDGFLCPDHHRFRTYDFVVRCALPRDCDSALGKLDTGEDRSLQRIFLHMDAHERSRSSFRLNSDDKASIFTKSFCHMVPAIREAEREALDRRQFSGTGCNRLCPASCEEYESGG